MKSLGTKNWLFFTLLLVGALTWGVLTSPPQTVQPPLTPPALPPVMEVGPAAAGWVSRQGVFLGRAFSIQMATDEARAVSLFHTVSQRLQQLESQLTSWHPGGEIARVNEQAGIAPTVVSSEVFKLLSWAKLLQGETQGAFDVTVSAVQKLWPSPNSPMRLLPRPEELQTPLKLVNAALIELDEKNSTAYLPSRGMQIDLAGLATSYVATVVLQLLKAQGIAQAAVGVDKEIYLLGQATTGPWQITLENPRAQGAVMTRFLTGVKEGMTAVITVSKDDWAWVRGGQEYSRLINPQTGWPVSNDCESVTIITENTPFANAYATAISVMGISQGLRWVEQRDDVAAFLVDTQGQVQVSSNWKQFTQPLISPPPTVSAIHSQGVTPPHVPRQSPPGQLVGQLAGRALDLRAGEMLEIPETVSQAAFFIDRTEVTNQQYERFLWETRGHPHEFCHPEEPRDKDHTPRYWREYRPPVFRATVAAELAPFKQDTFRQPDHPVVGVEWWDAYSFARWAGKRLPTQAEWQRAACGTDKRVWPWGSQWDFQKANIGGEKWGEQDGFTYSAPAVSFLGGASPYHVLNLAGNVSEWTQEGYVMGGSSKSSPTGVSCQAPEVHREPAFRAFDMGFRCVWQR